jgi:hypothetical protein
MIERLAYKTLQIITPILFNVIINQMAMNTNNIQVFPILVLEENKTYHKINYINDLHKYVLKSWSSSDMKINVISFDGKKHLCIIIFIIRMKKKYRNLIFLSRVFEKFYIVLCGIQNFFLHSNISYNYQLLCFCLKMKIYHYLIHAAPIVLEKKTGFFYYNLSYVILHHENL